MHLYLSDIIQPHVNKHVNCVWGQMCVHILYIKSANAHYSALALCTQRIPLCSTVIATVVS